MLVPDWYRKVAEDEDELDRRMVEQQGETWPIDALVSFQVVGGGYRSVVMFSCSVCGSVVADVDQDTHRAWHASVVKAVR